ncbi:MAG: methylenetetrahydrofolate--tRNA-(uracil(54)-C(5))-methyltransferase (FADH(2)-oxidizing) TrmFO [Oscillospiraceae bacterium]|nr:methylenetetrahydrofolate--tRNA-(uracil(54)-C(5))-methyltransferase (FADH(2)-oxidizing) TrmFO [Oscillospiraceae bacterium]
MKIIGGGLAGCEAAWQAANRGIEVSLYEMKPHKRTPAHKSDMLAELVCSNSLKADRIENACGLLKEEMRLLSSLIIEAADRTRVPAGGALAVDRDLFAGYITEKIKNHPNIRLINEEAISLDPDEYTVIAAGPLASEPLFEAIKRLTGTSDLYFYDAAAPVVTRESIDPHASFAAARYGRGSADYINCPMTKAEYDIFYDALISAETVPLKEFENQTVFEGCMPVEVMAKRGEKTLTFGPLKPVGLIDPRTGKDDAYAVVQLRQDNKEATLYNMVGFQTNLKFAEQKRVFSLIPALRNAEFVRFGVMHRNTYINSPMLLNSLYQMKKYPKIFFAGQITGVEGYVESASSGLLAGINAARIIRGKEPIQPSSKTAIGALCNYISDSSITKFQPMNSNFGIIESLGERIRKKEERYFKIAQRALDTIKEIYSKEIREEK